MVKLILFDFIHHFTHGIQGAAALLREFFQPLCLRQRWRCLCIVHCFQKFFLFRRFQIGKLYCRIEGDFLLIHHIQNFGNQVCKANIAKNLIFTCAKFFRHFLARQFSKIISKLGIVFFRWPSCLMLHCLQLHLVGKRSLAGKDIFPLQVTVHHENDCRIIVHFINDDRHCLQSCQLRRMKSAVSRKNFKSAFRVRPNNQR